MHNAWIALAGVAIGAVVLALQFIYNSQQQHEGSHRENGERSFRASAGDEPQNNTEPSGQTRRRKAKPPAFDDSCVICQELLFDDKAQEEYSLIPLHPCLHWFHKSCANKLARYNDLCPVCRIQFDKTKLQP